jgi:hypothetical protein
MLLFDRVNCNKNISNIVFSISWEKLSHKVQYRIKRINSIMSHPDTRSFRILTHETTLTSVVFILNYTMFVSSGRFTESYLRNLTSYRKIYRAHSFFISAKVLNKIPFLIEMTRFYKMKWMMLKNVFLFFLTYCDLPFDCWEWDWFDFYK